METFFTPDSATGCNLVCIRACGRNADLYTQSLVIESYAW